MSTNKRQLVLDALNNRKTERVPVGFWFHFAEGKEFFQGLENPSIIQRNSDGHQKFYHDFQPDFVKLMSDGFFGYPNPVLSNPKSAAELKSIHPIGKDHPWITKQVELVKKLTDSFGSEVLTFYNIFGPATSLKFLMGKGETGNTRLAELIEEDKDAVKYALDVIAQDLSILAERVITEGGADGIYLSVQNIQDKRTTKKTYRSVITPSEKKVLKAANKASKTNILHICGYEGTRNDLSIYSDYAAKAVNWAVTVEGVSLKAGKKLFGGKAVIGGFANTPGSLIHAGTREDIQAYTARLISENGKKGIIIGADCTVPSNIQLERLEWVRESATL